MDTPWQNCIAVNDDNTKAKVFARYFVVSSLLNTNHQTFISRCQCDLAGITVSHANDVFSEQIGVSVEDACLDCFYRFHKSTKSNKIGLIYLLW